MKERPEQLTLSNYVGIMRILYSRIPKGESSNMKRVLFGIIKTIMLLVKSVVCVMCVAMMVVLLASVAITGGKLITTGQTSAMNYKFMDRFDMTMTNTFSDVLDGILSIKKVYWLSDDDLIAPEPNQECFGETTDPVVLQALLDDAQDLLEGQQTLFTADRQIYEGSSVKYYLDDSILAVTWKELRDDSIYTIAEIKIADPSQFRRFLADGEYASGRQYVATEMAATVNAVVAANGDFYSFRDIGIIVHNGELMRMEGYDMDTCFIDKNGDLQFAFAREMVDRAETEKFLEENGVRFSIAFGPVLIENGELCKLPGFYPVGEGDIGYPRAALCQLDELHYLIVTVGAEPPYEKRNGHTLDVFAENLLEMGCVQAYNLDGGQSATLVMNDKTVNYVWMRKISDIIYFATAIPDGD